MDGGKGLSAFPVSSFHFPTVVARGCFGLSAWAQRSLPANRTVRLEWYHYSLQPPPSAKLNRRQQPQQKPPQRRHHRLHRQGTCTTSATRPSPFSNHRHHRRRSPSARHQYARQRLSITPSDRERNNFYFFPKGQ